MEDLSALAQVCVTLIENNKMTKEEAPLMIKEEVLNFYKKQKQEGEDV